MKMLSLRKLAPSLLAASTFALISSDAFARGHGVPAPELGSSAIGMLLAAAVAVYARNRGTKR